jgi:hypothetical protein
MKENKNNNIELQLQKIPPVRIPIIFDEFNEFDEQPNRMKTPMNLCTTQNFLFNFNRVKSVRKLVDSRSTCWLQKLQTKPTTAMDTPSNKSLTKKKLSKSVWMAKTFQ